MKKLQYLLALLICAINLHSEQFFETPPGPLEFGELPFDVQSYEANITLKDISTLEISGVVIADVRWNFNDKDKSFYFHLEGLEIDSVVKDSKKVIYKEFGQPGEDGHYFDVSNTGTNFSSAIAIYYHGKLSSEGGNLDWGGIHYEDSTLYALGVGFKSPYVSTTRHWMPCFDHPSDKAVFKAEFTVDPGMVLASTGILSGVIKEEDWKYTWQHFYPCATYMLTFAVSDFEQVVKNEVSDVPQLMYFTRQRDKEASDFAYSKVEEMASWFRERFGDYPFAKIGYVNTTKGAMEHQTMISMPLAGVRQAFNNKDSYNHTIAHELSHQWFGGLVTPYDFRDAWLNEGFAKYCESLIEEFRGGKESYFANLRADRNQYMSIANYEGVLPLYNYSRNGLSSNYPGTIYNKGAIVVAMLRHKLGDENFFAGIRKYLEENSYQNVTTEILRETLEESSSVLLGDFFEQWVYRAGWPVFDVDVHVTPHFTQIDLSQENDEKYTNFDVEIRIPLIGGGFEYIVIPIDDNGEGSVNVPNNIDFNFDALISDGFNTLPSLAEYRRAIVTVGVGEDELRNILNVFPNPSDGDITITFETSHPAKLQIADVLGRQLESTDYNVPDFYTLNFSGFAPGVYIVNLHTDNSTISKSVVVR